MSTLIDSWGYRFGERVIVRLPVDASTSAIRSGDFLTLGTAGYYQRAAAGSTIYAVAVEPLDTAPASDGLSFVLADVSNESVYEYQAGTGTLTAGMSGLNCDAAGPRTLDVTAATDKAFYIVAVSTATASAFVRLNRTAGGVV